MHDDAFVHVAVCCFFDFVADVDERSEFREFRRENAGICSDQRIVDAHEATKLEKIESNQ